MGGREGGREVRWKKERNHCNCVSPTQLLIEPEPMFDKPQLPAAWPFAHIRETTHLQISEPTLDSAQGKHFQHTMTIRNSTSLQTSPSRHAPELTVPAHHQMDSSGSKDQVTSNSAASPEILCAICSAYQVLVIPSATQLCYESSVLRVVSCSRKNHLSLFP